VVSSILYKRADWCKAKVGAKFESWPRCRLSLHSTSHFPHVTSRTVHIAWLGLGLKISGLHRSRTNYFCKSDRTPYMLHRSEVRPLSLYHRTWQSKNIHRISHASFM